MKSAAIRTAAPIGVKAKNSKPSNPDFSSSPLTTRFGAVARRVIMPPMITAYARGSRILDRLMPVV